MSTLADDLERASRGRPRLGPETKARAGRLQRRRLALRISPTALATAIGVPVERYRHWETAWNNQAAEECGPALAQHLHCATEWLVHGRGAAPDAPGLDEISISQVLSAAVVLSRDHRKRLAARLRARRVSMGYSAAELGRIAKVAYPALRTCESEFPERGVPAERVARLEAALEVPAGWLCDETVEALPPKAAPGVLAGFDATGTVAELIRHVSRALVATRARRRAGAWELPASAERDAQFFAARYGIHGEGAATLQAVANRTGLTRERVRQITDKLVRRSKGRTFPTEPLNRLIVAVSELVPAPVTAIDKRLRSLLGEDLSVEGADRFARDLFGLSVLNLQPGTSSPVARLGAMAVARSTGGDDRLSRLARSAALKMISVCGAANIYWVMGMIANKGVRANFESAARALSAVEGLEFLRDETDGWIWFGPDPRNRVVTVAEKVLAVARQRIDVEDIQEAIARSRRVQQRDKNWPRVALELPLMVLSAMLTRTPGIRTIQKNDYVLDVKPPLADVLSGTELAIYELLAERGGVSDRRYLAKKLVKPRKMTSISFQVVLDQSPILRRLDYGVYGLRGWPLDKGALGRALAAAVRNRGGGAHPIARATSGKFAFERHVTPFNLRTGVMTVPARIAEMCGEVVAYTRGDHVVHIRRYPHGCRALGLVRILKAEGVQVGMRLVIELDKTSRTLSLRRLTDGSV